MVELLPGGLRPIVELRLVAGLFDLLSEPRAYSMRPGSFLIGTTTTWTLAALNGRTSPYSSPCTETTRAAILETPGPKHVDSGTTFSPFEFEGT